MKTNNLEKENSEGDILDLLAEGYNCSWEKQLNKTLTNKFCDLNNWLYYAKSLNSEDLSFLEKFGVISKRELLDYSRLKNKLRFTLKYDIKRFLNENDNIRSEKKEFMRKLLTTNFKFQKPFYEKVLRYYAGLQKGNLITQNEVVLNEIRTQTKEFEPLIKKVKKNYQKIISSEFNLNCDYSQEHWTSDYLFGRWTIDYKSTMRIFDFIFSTRNPKVVLNKFNKEETKKIRNNIVKELKNYGEFVEKLESKEYSYNAFNYEPHREKTIKSLEKITEMGDVETLKNIKYACSVSIEAYRRGILKSNNKENRKYYEMVTKHFRRKGWIGASYNNFNKLYSPFETVETDNYQNWMRNAKEKIVDSAFNIIYKTSDLDKTTNFLVGKGLLRSAQELSSELECYFLNCNNNQQAEIFRERKKVYKVCCSNNRDFDS